MKKTLLALTFAASTALAQNFSHSRLGPESDFRFIDRYRTFLQNSREKYTVDSLVTPPFVYDPSSGFAFNVNFVTDSAFIKRMGGIDKAKDFIDKLVVLTNMLYSEAFNQGRLIYNVSLKNVGIKKILDGKGDLVANNSGDALSTFNEKAYLVYVTGNRLVNSDESFKLGTDILSASESAISEVRYIAGNAECPGYRAIVEYDRWLLGRGLFISRSSNQSNDDLIMRHALVFAHEFSHLLGAVHVNDGSLMDPVLSGNPAISYSTGFRMGVYLSLLRLETKK